MLLITVKVFHLRLSFRLRDAYGGQDGGHDGGQVEHRTSNPNPDP